MAKKKINIAVIGATGFTGLELVFLLSKHPRVNILKPGPGVGGHCIAVDPWFIINSLPDETKLIKAAREVNDRKPQYILSLIDKAIKSTSKEISDINISCLGISSKFIL